MFYWLSGHYVWKEGMVGEKSANHVLRTIASDIFVSPPHPRLYFGFAPIWNTTLTICVQKSDMGIPGLV